MSVEGKIKIDLLPAQKAKYNTVMLIDDSEIDNFINQKTIDTTNFARRIYVHSSGRSALDFIKNIERNPDIENELMPELIFVDINMPVLDGFQFADEFEKINRKIKAETKIVILTTSLDPADREKSKNNSVIKGYILKPLTKEVLDSL
jgi:CheY-like chemotaxis protein